MEFTMASGKKMELLVVDNHDDTAGPGADFLQGVLTDDAKALTSICFSTGSSPLPLYQELIKRHKEAGLNFANARAFLLDEYVGLAAGHPACFRSFMEDNFYRHIDIRPENIIGFFGPLEDHMQTCFRYEKEMAATGGIDLMILGIGRNGHIAFNEPGTHADSRTRMIKLDESTRQANARFFTNINEVPTHALSIGIGNILDAKNLILIASGESKASAIAKALSGNVDPQVPASHLQNFKGNLTVVVDKPAAAVLKL